MGDTDAAVMSPSTANSIKAKKKSQKRNSSKSKRKDELRSQAAASDVVQVQHAAYILHASPCYMCLDII